MADIDALANTLDRHQSNLANALGKLRKDVQPALLKSSVSDDVKTATLAARRNARSVVVDGAGDLRTTRIAIAGATVVGAIVLGVLLARR